MDTSSIALFQAMTGKMRELQAKQEVIAENIANADTPGYEARELVERDFSDVLSKVSTPSGAPSVAKPRIAMPAAMKALGSPAAVNSNSRVSRDSFEVKPNGNTVVLEDQLLSLANVQMEYTALTNLYRKQAGLLKTALGKGGNN
ncbi:flagellar basal body rod protein FlgB [Pedomonas sp. V897]|uniref:flagellar basal body rod protein FlgB n=1 Tax=Pedomonas sp. V897 TaxID=3446482 RepID=UPI003EE1995D